jgi:hypothetical protein
LEQQGILKGANGPLATEIAEIWEEIFGDDGQLATKRLTGHDARRKTPEKDMVLWDDEVPNFGLRLLASGGKSWIVRYRDRSARHYLTLGHPPEMTLATARRIARQKIADVRLRGLPLPAPHGTREGETFGEVAQELLVSLSRRWKPLTIKGARNDLRGRLLPFFGALNIAEVTKADVNRWRDSMALRSGAFNRSLPILSALMQEAEAFGYRKSGANPCRGIARYKRKSKERYLSMAEYRRLAGVLDQAKGIMPVAVPLIWLLIFTGARVGKSLDCAGSGLKGSGSSFPTAKPGPRCYTSMPRHEPCWIA